jgi:aspartate aminotransferase-like enzyme
MDDHHAHPGPVDPDGLMEFSVVFTDRSLNHMSKHFQGVMRDLSAGLKEVYGADSVAVVPGGGTYGMEAVARQFGTGAHALIVRNGWFSYRWTQIFEAGGFAARTTVMKARSQGNDSPAPFAPAPIEDVVGAIREARPDAVFAPHVETSAGIILSDHYIRRLSEAAHEVGAIMVLDCVASGCVWVDMKATGVDVVISAPQKGWSSTPAAGLVMMSDRAKARMETTTSNSFALDLRKWASIMAAYEAGSHAYHATMPTDALRQLRDMMGETLAFGFARAAEAQWELGRAVRSVLAGKGLKSVAAPGWEAPSVVVCFTDDPEIQSGRRFAAQGMQIAAGVPLQVDEPESFRSFRVGLFGLDKLKDVDGTVERFRAVADQVFP